MSEEQHKRMMKEAKEHPKPSQTGVAASHCGAGCTLGDIVADFAVFGFALTLWGSDLWASFVIDYILAWLLGIVLPVLHHRAHARHLRLGRYLGRHQSRYAVHHCLAARHVRLDAAYLLRDLSASAPSAHPGRLLVHDAVRHDCRLLHRVSL